MNQTQPTHATFTAFRGHERVASGAGVHVALAIREMTDDGDPTLILVFEDESGRQIDLDTRGSVEDITARFRDGGALPGDTAIAVRRPGRPKLGVVGREVTLLPRHWSWLQTQRGGPSASLRRLVDEARASSAGRDRARHAQDAINRFISAIAGDLPGFEEANRALYRGERRLFDAEIAGWPADVRGHVSRWADVAFSDVGDA